MRLVIYGGDNREQQVVSVPVVIVPGGGAGEGLTVAQVQAMIDTAIAAALAGGGTAPVEIIAAATLITASTIIQEAA